MTSQEFLEAIWPDVGVYCIAVAAKGKGYYRHYTHDTIAAAASCAAKYKDAEDVYFCIHTLKEHRVWVPQKRKDKNTGEWIGGWTYRAQTNTRAARAFFFDLDVGENKGYATQKAAVEGVKAFSEVTGLPIPMIVSSGRGIHVYWLLDSEIPSEEWRGYAHKLRALANARGLRVDPSRTVDTSSVLRVAGTFNHKGAPLPVAVWRPGAVTATGEFIAALEIAADGLGTGFTNAFRTNADDGLGGSTTITYDGPPVKMLALMNACPQVKAIAVRKGNTHYVAWHKWLNVVRFVENGRLLAQKLSEGHPRYDYDYTEGKLDTQEGAGIGPTSCQVLHDNCDSLICEGCYFWGQVKGPLVAARRPQPAESQTPEPPKTEEGQSVNVEILPLPEGYMRPEAGGVIFNKRTEDKTIPILILRYDLYPVRRLVDEDAAIDQTVWCVKLPREKDRLFTIDSGLLQDQTLLGKELSRHEIYVLEDNRKMVQRYMSLYLQDLQKSSEAERQISQLGWIEDYQRFVLHDKIIARDGTETPAYLRPAIRRKVVDEYGMGRKGTMEAQIAALQFFNKAEYVSRQFYILASLASPVFHMTKLAGSVIHANGSTGAAKSGALGAAMSMWGHPIKLAINALDAGATANARQALISVMSNLPVGLDEITDIADEAAQAFALGSSQSKPDRARLDRGGELRAGNINDKSGLILTTGNISLHASLSNNNAAGDAGSMRVFEIPFEVFEHEKAAYEQFLHILIQNYGWIGEPFIRHVLTHYDEVAKLVHDTKVAFAVRARFKAAERFWESDCGSILAVAKLTYDLGLLPFRPEPIAQWLLDVQLPRLRGTVKDSYASPVEVLSNYITTIIDNMVIIPEGNTGCLKEPRDKVKARYEEDKKLLWLHCDHLKTYCQYRKVPFQMIVHELTVNQIVVNRRERKVLTSGTTLPTARDWCILVNMAHEEMADQTPTLDVVKQSARPVLRMVKSEA